MEKFYMILPSNVKRPDAAINKISDFTTYLPRTIELPGKWEVALVKLTYPESWYNVARDENVVQILHEGKTSNVEIPAGYYGSPNAFAIAFTRAIPGKHAAMIYNAVASKILLNINPGTAIRFSEILAAKLGFKSNAYENTENKVRRIKGDDDADLNTDMHYIYVYCDVIKETIVGNTYTKTLGVINTGNQSRRGKLYNTHELHNLIYMPIAVNSLQNINIKLYTDGAQPIKFEAGKAIAILHFKRVAI